MIDGLVEALDGQLTLRQLPVLPPHTEHVWEWFFELNRSRGEGLNGWLAISNLEILSWCALTGVRLLPWELSAIRAMDERFVRGRPQPTEPVSPEMFDRLFG